MDFAYDEEQRALRDAVRGLLGRAYGEWERRRRVAAEDPGYSPETWRGLAEMGVLALPFAEDDGGMGAGLVEVGIVAEELGRVLAPEPYLPVVLLAGGAVAASGSADQRHSLLGPLMEGERLLGWAHPEPGAASVDDRPTTRAEQDGDGWRLTGVKDPVVAGGAASHLVVTAALPGETGTGLFVVGGDADGVSRTTYRTHDGTRAATVRLDGAAAAPLGTGGDAAGVVSRLLATARVVAAHDVLGGMEHALGATRHHLTSRRQFGVTLNSFQALTFRAADLYVDLETTRSLVLWAAMVLEDARTGGDGSGAAEAAARAALQASRAGRHVFEEAIQLHGGIAMTAEYVVGHHLSRLVALEQLVGTGRQRLAALAATVAEHDELDPLR